MTDVYRSIANVMVLLQRGDGRVLAVRHGPDSAHSPGLLTVVGGRLEADEFLDVGAARELFEEVGISANPLQFCQLVHFFTPDGELVIGAAFTTRQWEGEPYNAEPHKHTELVWVEPASPPGDCHPFTREVLLNFAARRPYANIVAPRQGAGGVQ
ncbi:NUDIX domain-containing protein [Streptomyces sp. RKAG337]|uniref:NUDIX domain-containing protein n=1 Tax=Streptomyces sp. RKAG337 TaxID=2893404 RepID=UPI002033B4FE|nr:NUDIX domain-containing protein [Streptomyces sp. RKAG337]MCM2431039.1 NUDIX domain-containing protein [Streptomyces sp. RKAG337]